jgi:hypothetical protein
VHTSSQQQVAGMQLCTSGIAFNFLLIAKMRQHDSAPGTKLAFCGIANGSGQGPVCLKNKSFFQLYKFYIEELKKKGQGSLSRACSTIGKHHP